MPSQDAEDLLQLHHGDPVVSGQVVAEVLLQLIDRLARQLGHNLVRVVEVTFVHDGAVVDDLDRHVAVLGQSDVDRLPVGLDGLDGAQTQVAAVRHAQGGVEAQNSLFHVDTNDDGRLSIEACAFDHLKDARENGFRTVAKLALLLALLLVVHELVEQVVNDLCLKNLNSFLLSDFHSLRLDLDIEGQDCSVLLLYLGVDFGSASLHHVLFVDGANAHSGDWDLFGLQEVQECFKRADRRSLHADTLLGLVDVLVEDILDVTLNLSFCLFDLLLCGALDKLSAGKSVLHARGRNLDADSALKLLVVDVVTLDAHFFHRLRCQQCTDRCHDRPVHTRDDDGIADFQHTVSKHHVDRHTVTCDFFHFKNRAFEVVLFEELFALGRLPHLDQIENQV